MWKTIISTAFQKQDTDQEVGTGRPVIAGYAVFAGIASVCTVMFLILIKAFAYWESDSASVLASLIDSLVDAGVSLVTLLGIQYSLKPADEDHRYGHGKIEGVIALFQAAFITGAGVLLFFESLRRFANPTEIENSLIVYVVMGISIVLSLVLVAIQKYTLKMAPSIAVQADKTHYSMDIVINMGVIVTMFAMTQGAPAWLDPAYAIMVAFYISFAVRDIAGQGLDMLLDRELPDETRNIIIEKITAHDKSMGFHDLRTRKSGMTIMISFDLEVDASLSLADAHNIARDIEINLLSAFPNAEVLIHVDPHNDTDDSRHSVAGIHH